MLLLLLTSCQTFRPLSGTHFDELSWLKGYFVHPGQELYENWVVMQDRSIEHITFHYEDDEPVIRQKKKIYPAPGGVRMLTTHYNYENTELSNYYLVTSGPGIAMFTSPDKEKVKSIRFTLLPDSSIRVKLFRLRPQKDSSYLIQRWMSVRNSSSLY